jgi:hypothetical protein
MLRYLSIALFTVLLSAQVVWAEAITHRFLSANPHVVTVEYLGVPVTTWSTLSVADLLRTLQSPTSTLSDDRAALAGAVSPAGAGPGPRVALSVAEPATLALLGIGFLLLSAFGHRRRERSGRHQ